MKNTLSHIVAEKWKEIAGYEGFYDVSNFGRVKSLARKYSRKERYMKVHKCGTKYLYAMLSRNNKTKSYRVHRLVAIAFLPNSKNVSDVNHLDGDPTNNAIENLEWCTRKENIRHSVEMGLHPVGERNGSAKLTGKQVKKIRELREGGMEVNAITKLFPVTKHTIHKILSRNYWKHI